MTKEMHSATARKKVLVADCHEEVLITLQKMLEDAGYDTTIVWTASEALKLLESGTFDLVLTNEYLPDAECEDLLKALQKQRAQVPCIVMQPSAPEITNSTSLEALGVRDIVYKYAYRQIVSVVNERLLKDHKPQFVS